jgi:CBS domain-containing protein
MQEAGVKARDMMTPAPACATREDTVQKAAALMRDLDVGFIPIVDDRDSMRLVGVLTDRDIAIRCVADGHHPGESVGSCMTSGYIARVDPDADMDEVVEQMKTRQLRRVAVVEAEDRLVGVISQADLATENHDSREVANTLARVSEPAEPRRSGKRQPEGRSGAPREAVARVP